MHMNTPNKFVLGVHGDGEPSQLVCTAPIAIAAGASNVVLDLSAAQSMQSLISCVLTLYINNKGNVQALTMTMASGQVLVFPANSQGYVTILQPNPFSIVVSNPGTAASIMPMNFFVPNIIWATA